MRRREESLPELAEDIKRLARLAYPDAAEEILAKDQFADALLEDMQLRIRQNRPATLRAALELESYQLASRDPGLYVKEFMESYYNSISTIHANIAEIFNRVIFWAPTCLTQSLTTLSRLNETLVQST